MIAADNALCTHDLPLTGHFDNAMHYHGSYDSIQALCSVSYRTSLKQESGHETHRAQPSELLTEVEGKRPDIFVRDSLSDAISGCILTAKVM